VSRPISRWVQADEASSGRDSSVASSFDHLERQKPIFGCSSSAPLSVGHVSNGTARSAVQTKATQDLRELNYNLVYRRGMPSVPNQTRWERFKLWLARRISNRK
jgi:hypothetical protein